LRHEESSTDYTMAKTFKVLVRCPKSGKSLQTGVETYSREALNTTVFQDAQVYCQDCQVFHPYDGNAYLDVIDDRSTQDLWRPNP
jgi:hypothetical protein